MGTHEHLGKHNFFSFCCLLRRLYGSCTKGNAGIREAKKGVNTDLEMLSGIYEYRTGKTSEVVIVDLLCLAESQKYLICT